MLAIALSMVQLHWFSFCHRLHAVPDSVSHSHEKMKSHQSLDAPDQAAEHQRGSQPVPATCTCWLLLLPSVTPVAIPADAQVKQGNTLLELKLLGFLAGVYCLYLVSRDRQEPMQLRVITIWQ
jgi:hypothetical protein